MAINAFHLGKFFGEPPTRVLTDITISVADGEFVSLTGRSGSGKSTLLYILSSLDTPSEGKVEVFGSDLAKMSSDQLSQFRNEKIGFVFQSAYLIAELPMLDNVMMPALKYNKAEDRLPYAKHLLDQFGLTGKFHRYPRQLSGGEQQRVAIARALVMEPKIIFADEPTGALDSVSGENVMNILSEVNQKNKTTIIMVTHDPDFAKLAHRQIRLADGKIAEIVEN